MDKETWDLLKDGMKILVGGLVGFGAGWWGHIVREWRDHARLQNALFQELANCYEALAYHSETSDFDFFKTKFKHEVVFMAFEAASKNPGAFYTISHHGWLTACFRELKKMCEFDSTTDNKDVLKLVGTTMGTIEKTPDGDAQKRLRKALQPKYRNKFI